MKHQVKKYNNQTTPNFEKIFGFVVCAKQKLDVYEVLNEFHISPRPLRQVVFGT